jgi:hypothetical protein
MPSTPPVSNPVMNLGQLSGGLARRFKSSDRDLPRSLRQQAETPEQGNTGYGRFLAKHRGARGGREISGFSKKSGAVYTEGRFKGLTEGQADVKADANWGRMSEEQRDAQRTVTAGDYEAKRKRALQAEKDKFEIAREQEALIRGDIAKEKEDKIEKDKNANKYIPPGSETDEDPNAGAVVTDAEGNPSPIKNSNDAGVTGVTGVTGKAAVATTPPVKKPPVTNANKTPAVGKRRNMYKEDPVGFNNATGYEPPPLKQNKKKKQ